MNLHLPDPMGSAVGGGYMAYLMAVVFLASAFAVLYRDRKPEMDRMYPVVNSTKEEYFANGRGMVQRGKEMYGDSPFRVYTGMGSVLILPPKYASEIKNDNRFDASKFLLQVLPYHSCSLAPFASLEWHSVDTIRLVLASRHSRLRTLHSTWQRPAARRYQAEPHSEFDGEDGG